MSSAQGRPSPQQPWCNPFPSFLSNPLTGLCGVTSEKFLALKRSRWIFSEFWTYCINRHLYEPGFLTVSCSFRISSKWHLTVTGLSTVFSSCWHGTRQMRDAGNLGLNVMGFRKFQVIFLPPPWNFSDTTCIIPPRMDAPPYSTQNEITQWKSICVYTLANEPSSVFTAISLLNILDDLLISSCCKNKLPRWTQPGHSSWWFTSVCVCVWYGCVMRGWLQWRPQHQSLVHDCSVQYHWPAVYTDKAN